MYPIGGINVNRFTPSKYKSKNQKYNCNYFHSTFAVMNYNNFL